MMSHPPTETKISCGQEVEKESGVPAPPPELRLAFEVYWIHPIGHDIFGAGTNLFVF